MNFKIMPQSLDLAIYRHTQINPSYTYIHAIYIIFEIMLKFLV